MLRLAIIGAILSLPLAAESVAAKEVILAPNGPWALDYADSRCRLLRKFGEGDDRHILLLEQNGPSKSMAAVAAGPVFDRFRPGRKVSVRFGEGLEDEYHQPLFGQFEPIGSALIYSVVHIPEPDVKEGDRDGSENNLEKLALGESTLPQLDIDSFAEIDSITFSQRSRAVIMQTGNMADPMKALNDCSLDFIRHWGLDLDKHLTQARTPKWLNAREVVPRITRSYSSAALRKGEQGIFQMRMIVDDLGEVAEYHIENTTEMEELESPACREMARAKFDPALDADGNPMRSFYTTRIVYRIPR